MAAGIMPGVWWGTRSPEVIQFGGSVDMEFLPSDIEAKTFRTARRGFDRDEVAAYLRKVAAELWATQERAKIAAVKADRLEIKLIELQRSVDPVATAYDDALALRRRLVEEAEQEAERIRAEAVAALPERPESVEIVEAARAEAARLEAEAQGLVSHARAMAAHLEAEAAETLSESRARADRLLADASAEAERMTVEASTEARWIVSRAAAEVEPQRPTTEPYRPAADGSALVEPRLIVDPGADDMVVDLTDTQPAPPAKPTRYAARSAGLPRLGEGANSVLGEMQKMRHKEPEG